MYIYIHNISMFVTFIDNINVNISIIIHMCAYIYSYTHTDTHLACFAIRSSTRCPSCTQAW